MTNTHNAPFTEKTVIHVVGLEDLVNFFITEELSVFNPSMPNGNSYCYQFD